MSARILYGHPAAERLLAHAKQNMDSLHVGLAIVQVGSDPASTRYINTKLQKAQSIGIEARHIHLAEDIDAESLFTLIRTLNADRKTTGYIIQLPLPKHLQPVAPLLFRAIDPAKDVDGFTAYNVGKMFLSTEFEHLPPATPAGIIALLEHENIPIRGMNATVVGHSNIVGKPLAIMLVNRGATVTVCHADTRNLAEHTKNADILVSAVGKANLITADMVCKHAVVIDVGMNDTPDGLRGDVHPDVATVASALTPVPGGVGPMTVAHLLSNCVTAAKRQMHL